MLLTAELAALNLDPAQQEGVVAAVLPLHAEAEKLRAQAKLDTLKIQALTLELAHLRRIRFGVKNEALSPEQRDLFRETADADSAAIEADAFDAAILVELLDSRTANGLRTIATTNCNDAALMELLGERGYSRLLYRCAIAVLDGDDKRINPPNLEKRTTP